MGVRRWTGLCGMAVALAVNALHLIKVESWNLITHRRSASTGSSLAAIHAG